jgi:ZIP family zinc transporter
LRYWLSSQCRRREESAVSLSKTLLLGLIAGATILLGLPLGRVRKVAVGVRVFLNAIAVGILVFLVWDVLSAAWEPLDARLGALHEGSGGFGGVLGYGVLFFGFLAIGLLSMVWYENFLGRSVVRPKADAPTVFGPGAMHAAELSGAVPRARGAVRWSNARRLSLLIAVGIGLHNFAEGLAIGQSAATGAIGLATMLVIGFATHNATEGFGIVAPLAGDLDESGVAVRPSWGFLLSMGAIGGAPTFVGTLVGHSFTSEPVAVAFLALAAGSILYVVVQLVGVAAKSRRMALLYYGLLLGLFLGFLTDGILIAGGA